MNAKLQSILDRIYNANICGIDNDKVKRNIDSINLYSKLMIVAEAMAPNQVRVSGLNYFDIKGNIGSTGKSLEKFINQLGYTVYPYKENTIYHTEIVHSFPGYESKSGKKVIRRPTKKEIEESIKTSILVDEILLLNPKVILLMGNTSYTTFYKYIIKKEIVRNLTREIEYITQTGNYEIYNSIAIIPIQHSSGANPRFNSMIKNTELVNLISRLLS